jgi:hypothetical protein
MHEESGQRTRQLNDASIQQNNQLLDSLKKSLEQSNDQTKKMTSLLDNFEQQLTTMRGHIMPVYEATNILQVKYSSKTSKSKISQ